MDAGTIPRRCFDGLEEAAVSKRGSRKGRERRGSGWRMTVVVSGRRDDDDDEEDDEDDDDVGRPMAMMNRGPPVAQLPSCPVARCPLPVAQCTWAIWAKAVSASPHGHPPRASSNARASAEYPVWHSKFWLCCCHSRLPRPRAPAPAPAPPGAGMPVRWANLLLVQAYKP